MRGSALIFHSLDPETLDKIDDLTSLDSLDFDDEAESDNKYLTLSESPSQVSPPPPHHYETGNLVLNESLSFQTKSSSHIVPGVNNPANCGREHVPPKAKSETTPSQTTLSNDYGQRRRNCGTNNATTTTSETPSTETISASFPILDQLMAISSSSPLSSSPLNKSNYSKVDGGGKQLARSQQQSTKSQNFIPDHNPNHHHLCEPRRVSSNRQRRSNDSSSNIADINEAVTQGRRISTSSQCHIKEKTFTSNYSGAGLPLSRLKETRLGRSSSTNSISTTTSQSPRSMGSTGENIGNQNSRGFARFLFGLDFRQNKEDKSKLDVYNLSPKLKAELKRIYVY